MYVSVKERSMHHYSWSALLKWKNIWRTTKYTHKCKAVSHLTYCCEATSIVPDKFFVYLQGRAIMVLTSCTQHHSQASPILCSLVCVQYDTQKKSGKKKYRQGMGTPITSITSGGDKVDIVGVPGLRLLVLFCFHVLYWTQQKKTTENGGGLGSKYSPSTYPSKLPCPV